MQFRSARILKADRQQIDVYLLEQEHRSISEHIDTLVDVIMNDDNSPDQSLIVRRRFECIESSLHEHLENESTYIASGLHGECDSHQADHRTFQRAIAGLRRRFELEPNERSTAGVAIFLRNWWMSHVNAMEQPNMQQRESSPTIQSGS